MEAHLFSLMSAYGFGGAYIERFRMMTAFHQQRIPLIVLISGTGCTGKSTLATQLAERLNLPHVTQTDLLCTLMASVQGTAPRPRLWTRRFGSEEALLAEYEREACAVRQALEGDLQKVLKDGKATIVEGVSY